MNSSIVKTFIFAWFGFWGILAGFVGYTLLSLPEVSELRTAVPETSAFIEYRKKQAEEEGKELKVRYQWVPLSEIPELFQRIVVVSEDAAFWTHEGIDWFEVKEALRQNIEEGKRLRGASTITQQTAKNLYLNPDRSLYRKALEFLITRDLEKHLPKQRILEVYLNIIEFGDGIFGVKSAAQYYFGKNPSQLTLHEMIRLAAIIPNPLILHPKQPTGQLKWRCYEILRRLYRFQYISEEEYQAANGWFGGFFSK